MTVNTAAIRRMIARLYLDTSCKALDDPKATIDQLENRAHKIRRAYRNDLHSLDNVETMARWTR